MLAEIEHSQNGHVTERLTVKQAADYLGITQAAIYTAQGRGLLPREYNDVGKLVLSRTTLDEYRERVSAPQTPIQGQGEEMYETVDTQPVMQSEQLPACHRCQRQFEAERDYTIEKFVVNGHPFWYPACADRRCDPQEQTALKREQEKNARLIQALKSMQAHITALLREYEE